MILLLAEGAAMASIERARSLYVTLSEVQPRLGPYLMSREGLGAVRTPFFDYPPLQKVISEIEEVPISGSGTLRQEKRRFRAPSPWHAALFLMFLFDVCTAGKPNYRAHKGPLLFRGHADVDWQWNMTPRLWRPESDSAVSTRTLQLFSAIVQHAFASASYPDFSALAITATAQHYGIATDLLDFTVDPSVAVWFAVSGRKLRNDQEAAVFYLPADTALDVGARIILAPPLIQRVYLQRAVFVQHAQAERTDLAEVCAGVQFPLDQSFKPVLDCDSDSLLQDEAWLRETVKWAAGLAKSEVEFAEEVNERNSLIEQVCHQLQLRDSIVFQQQLLDRENWTCLVADLLYRTILTVHGDQDWTYEKIGKSFALENRAVFSGLLRLGNSWLQAKKTECSTKEVHALKRMLQVLSRFVE